jgi:hypothetical protein
LQRKIDQTNTNTNRHASVASAQSAVSGTDVEWERLRILEQEKAELIAKCTSLEAELATVHQHYKKELNKYKKIIIKLQNNSKNNKQKHKQQNV